MTFQRLFLLALVLGLIGLVWRKSHDGSRRPELFRTPTAAVVDPGH